ncbi:MAG: hypothetical protein Q9162_000723 [Coniocarpon cinnabarinum]
MAPPRKSPAFGAQISLSHGLSNCLVNIPAPLANAISERPDVKVQHVVVELAWNVSASNQNAKPRRKVMGAGWTGMASKKQQQAALDRGGRPSKAPEILEIDPAFARINDIEEGQRVEILIHTDPPKAHTVEVEPATTADWEMIELHSDFLETHFLSQIRALPDPSFKPTGNDPPSSHPLILHLSPTSTATVYIRSLKLDGNVSKPSRHVRIEGSDCEVHVAPKPRQKAHHEEQSAQSIDGRSGAGSSKTRSTKQESRPTVFVRGVSRQIADEYFDDEEEDNERDEGLQVWVDKEVLDSHSLRGSKWVWVSIVRPAGLRNSVQEEPEAMRLATRIVAQLSQWEDAPEPQMVAVSSQLCAALDAPGMTGETIRLEAAPPQMSKSAVRSLKVYPFAGSSEQQRDGFRFGSKLRADQQEAAQRLLTMFHNEKESGNIFRGPITDGMLLLPNPHDESQTAWPGGIVKFHPPSGPFLDAQKTTRGWILGSDRKLSASSSTESPKGGGSDRRLSVEVSTELVQPVRPSHSWNIGEQLPHERPMLVGVDAVIDQVQSSLRHSSSCLLTGGHGAGKSTMTHLVAHDFHRDLFAHVESFPCYSLVTDETRVNTIKDTINRLFAKATWGARLGGRSLVVLDDLDSLCPAENELEIGNENSRNRQVSEIVQSVIRQHCTLDSRVSLLATAQSKDALHNIIVGGHAICEYAHLHAPDKDTRRKILEFLGEKDAKASQVVNGVDDAAHVDYLDVAGRTDGYMPGDLKALMSRARSEALIRSISANADSNAPQLTDQDFDNALKGFTPTSLRNVTLQHSTTSFSSIGGLKHTRQMLLETLQYPTLYAPIFANCPLRLRSGLLLYGFPGCGKTLLASAVAGECGLNFISVKGPEILNKYIGASEKSVRDLFERAQAARPCVLFFDEFDSVAPKRGHDSTGVTDRVVNQLLTQMDGAEGLSGVYVLAATSRPDLIDPALLRPGRLDKSLLCEMPNLEDREDIVRALGSKLKITQDAKARLREVAQETEGYTGADLQAVVYNSHLEAIHDAIGDTEMHVSPRQNGTSAGRNNEGNKTSIPDFTFFRASETHSAPTSSASIATERAQIAQQLRAHKFGQQRLKAARRDSFAEHSTTDEQDDTATQGEDHEPTIEWRHVRRGLGQTRPSISTEEVRRLEKIYREFVDARSGEMPSGQGGREVGGRSSLM